MKNNSKIIFTVLSVSLLLSMASCGSNNDSDKTSSEVTQTQTTEATTEVTKADTTENADNSSMPDETELPGEEIDLDTLIYDFSGLDSGEMVQSFTDGKYMISYSIKGYEETVQTMYFDEDKALVHMNSQGIEYDMIYMDNKRYNIYKDSKYTEDAIAKAEHLNIFGKFGYIGSGRTDFEGKDCKYDEYYDKGGRLRTKVFIDDSGKIIALEEAGTVLYIKDFKSDFDSDKIISVPENCEEVSKDKFTMIMYDLYNQAAGTATTAEITEITTAK